AVERALLRGVLWGHRTRGFTKRTSGARFSTALVRRAGASTRSSFVVLDRVGGRNFMDSEFLLRFARRMRELMLRARTEPAREQLRIWAEEFEARAAAVETEQQGSHGRAGPDNPSNCPSR